MYGLFHNVGADGQQCYQFSNSINHIYCLFLARAPQWSKMEKETTSVCQSTCNNSLGDMTSLMAD